MDSRCVRLESQGPNDGILSFGPLVFIFIFIFYYIYITDGPFNGLFAPFLAFFARGGGVIYLLFICYVLVFFFVFGFFCIINYFVAH